MSDMSDTRPLQQLTVTAESRGVMPRFSWLAWCQQCELKKPFADYDRMEEWVTHHRRIEGHRVQFGGGKL